MQTPTTWRWRWLCEVDVTLVRLRGVRRRCDPAQARIVRGMIVDLRRARALVRRAIPLARDVQALAASLGLSQELASGVAVRLRGGSWAAARRVARHAPADQLQRALARLSGDIGRRCDAAEKRPGPWLRPRGRRRVTLRPTAAGELGLRPWLLFPIEPGERSAARGADGPRRRTRRGMRL